MESKAQAAESLLAASSGKDALQHAIHAAELYMQAATTENVTKAEAVRLRRKCRELIAFAEHLKAQLKGNRSSTSTAALSISSSSVLASCSSPTEQEMELLHRASRLSGCDYPIWESEPSDTEFLLTLDAQLFVDHTDFSLSPTQHAHFASWSRPEELFNISGEHRDDLMRLQKTCDFVQDVTTDCSVVAGLSAAAVVLTGRHLVLSRIIYPFDHEKKQPKLSPSGKYILRMNFNGCHRRVFIDDRLPASRTDRVLFVMDRHNPHLIWPALLEKAYLKVRGGYDFPGSNSGTDLWVLTGWIPEQIFLQREDFDIDETWSRIQEAYLAQDVVITLGTGQVSREEEELMGLVGNHDFAIQDIQLHGTSRKFLVKNPWSHDHDQEATIPLIPGAFWMSIEEVAQHFESMYLNWNPALFSHRQDCHFEWRTPPRYFQASLARHPQFSLVSSSGGSVWILLSRHFMDGEIEIARDRSNGMDATNRQLGFMNISLHDNCGNRVLLCDRQLYRGPYVDSPQTLARIQASPGKAYTIAIDHQEVPLDRYTFTLSIFSHRPVSLKNAEEKMPHSKQALGNWNRRSAGGNSLQPTYCFNPQFRLRVLHKTSVSILLSADKSDIHVHVDLLWARGERANTVRLKDLVASSGDYRRACAVADIAELNVGAYTLVCSTFEAGQMAAFVLQVASEMPISLEPVPNAMAGRLCTALAPLTPMEGDREWRAMLDVSSLTRAHVSIRTSESANPSCRSRSSTMIRILIIRGRGPEQIVLAQSGEGNFEDSINIIQTPEFDLEPTWVQTDGVWLVLESTGPDSAARTIHGEIFSDSPMQVTKWNAS